MLWQRWNNSDRVERNKMRFAFTCLTILFLASIAVAQKTTSCKCGQCKDDAPCSIDKCICPGGCKSFWIGPACNIEIPAVPDCHTNCNWIVEADATSLTIGWCQIEDFPGEFINHYGYIVEYVKYGQLGASRTKSPPIAHNVSSKIQTFVISELLPQTQYELTVWPYRMADGIYDYGTKYDRIVGETQSASGLESSVSMPLPWILFGVACLVIVGLSVTILSMYLKYIRRRSPSPARRIPDPELRFDPPDSVGTNMPRSATNLPTSADRNPAIYQHTILPKPEGNEESNYEHLKAENATYQNDDKRTYEKLSK